MPTATTVLKQPKHKVVCTSCGSDDVVVDAWAEWNVPKQQWQLAETFESTAYCRNCDGECSIREVRESNRTMDKLQA